MTTDAAEQIRAAIARKASLLDEAFAAAARRYKEVMRLGARDLEQATLHIRRLSGDGACDYTRPGVPFEYVLRYQGRQVNASVSALVELVLEHDGPVRIVDVGAGTGAIEVGVATILAALDELGLAGTRRIEVVAVERSLPMALMGRLVLEELTERMRTGRMEVQWRLRLEDVPEGASTQAAPTWLVGVHLLHPTHRAERWAAPLHHAAGRLAANHLVLTSSRRGADFDLIRGVQATLRRKSGIGGGAWDLRTMPDRVPQALITGDPGAVGLPCTAMVAREFYDDAGPLPLWFRCPPYVYQLRRNAARAAVVR